MSSSVTTGVSSQNGNNILNNNNSKQSVISLVDELLNGSLRENALSELSKQREQIPDLAVILWNRVGTTFCFNYLVGHYCFFSFFKEL